MQIGAAIFAGILTAAEGGLTIAIGGTLFTTSHVLRMNASLTLELSNSRPEQGRQPTGPSQQTPGRNRPHKWRPKPA